jgi:hypothetical protein
VPKETSDWVECVIQMVDALIGSSDPLAIVDPTFSHGLFLAPLFWWCRAETQYLPVSLHQSASLSCSS